MSPRAACRLETLGFGAVHDYTTGKADWLAAGLPTEGPGASRPRPAGLARSDVPTCLPGEPVEAARARVASSDEERCIVVSSTGVVLGTLGADTLSEDGTRAAGDAMRLGPTTVRADEDLDGLTERMHRRNVTSIIVTDPEGRLLGVSHRDDGDTAIRHGEGA